MNAFTLLGFYLQETEKGDTSTWNLAPPPFPIPERALAIYARPNFTLLRPSELREIILNHIDAWKANQATLLMTLRMCEGKG